MDIENKINRIYMYDFFYHRNTKHEVLWVIKTEKHIIIYMYNKLMHFMN